MTDADIIKALECCIKNRIYAYCDNRDCPYFDVTNKYSECKKMLFLDITDLINRQKAEIERLRKDCGIQSALWSKHYEDIFEIAKGIIKAEAIKEFAERFESKLNCIPQHHFTLAQVLFDLDKTKKEMAGVTE